MDKIVNADPERLAKALEDRVDVTNEYDHSLWELARKNRLQQEFNEGQTKLNSFGFNICYNGSAEAINSFKPVKSVQTKFKITGGDFMTEEHDSIDLDVQDRPERTTKSAEITAIRTGARQEFYDPEDDGEYKYGSASDPMIQIVLEYEHDGAELEETQVFRYYDNPDPRSNLGKFVKRYGAPEKGLEVNIDFDENGQGSIVLP